ncbi:MULTISPECIES: LysR family transcriptional regulator [unclassified Arsukibacterium]|uniref:LysR family transcriptional regulator n=1 Tax=unclassified Arsukibacterium TaxID=2635278 RepID=UPI000C39A182|nr:MULTISPECIES: LysR family transcriptional regulator [unclassified Arsukibacterium]MAA94001.1 LysR family transcriptional regulator [Rheinheimera sp.]MBM35498.1 LysR family transcriptional regulator [Rheinheimera sp.]HAW93590.1 LysR family transcriptional regulator [Candidatus Azambacteria bacterium]|tara:strand:- start:66687 stop:67586 length:900 start_codon:yes stop_codon:yes gene_type:complete
MTIISKTEELEILLAVADSGGFSAAATALNIQVAKASRAIQRLETELQCNLFNRTTRRVTLTDEGALFVQRIRSGLDSISSAEEQLRLARGMPSGRLRIDAATPFILNQLVPLMAEFSQDYPLIVPELIGSENIIDLIEKRTDVAIRIGRLSDSNLHAKLLGRSTLRMVASSAYLARSGIPNNVADLSKQRWLAFTPPTTLNSWALVGGEVFSIPAGTAMYSSSGEVLKQLCLAGNGIALLSDFMIHNELQSGSLVEVLPGSVLSPNDRELVQAVYYRNTTLSSRISAFTGFLQQRLTL